MDDLTVMEYDHERAVADGVNVNYDVYRIKTAISDQGSKVEAGYYIDCVGGCEMDKTDSRPMERKPSVSLEKLMQAVSLGNIEPDVISSIAGRLARIARRIDAEDGQKVKELTDGKGIEQLTTDLVTALKPDNHIERARQENPGVAEPTEEQTSQAAEKIIQEAVKPLYDPRLHELILAIKKKERADHRYHQHRPGPGGRFFRRCPGKGQRAGGFL